MQNTFANECFLDELAAELKADPHELRVKYTDPADTRGLEVLERLARLANWEKRPSPQKNITSNVVRGRGMSYVKYELVRTYVGVVAEVAGDHVRIEMLHRGTARDLAEVVGRLDSDGLGGLILDLRWSPGGFFDEARDVAGLFLDDVVLATTDEHKGIITPTRALLRLEKTVQLLKPALVIVENAADVYAGN